jgi:hypothetical protein
MFVYSVWLDTLITCTVDIYTEFTKFCKSALDAIAESRNIVRLLRLRKRIGSSRLVLMQECVKSRLESTNSFDAH